MRKLQMFFILLLLSTAAASAQVTVNLSPVASGATAMIGYYIPQQLALSVSRPASLKTPPPGLSSPLYGILPVKSEGRKLHVVLDRKGNGESVLYVDSNGDGDMTNDPAPRWDPHKAPTGFTTYTGGAFVILASGGQPIEVRLTMYCFDPKDPSYAAYKTSLMYYRDYAATGDLPLGGKTYKIVLSDEKASGDYRDSAVRLLIDLNADSRFTTPRESLDPSAPFNVGGTTWEIRDVDPLGRSFRLVKSSKTVAETLPPPDHSVGKTATPFTAKDMDGKPVSFPSGFSGRIVMLDFWATWCGPCMGEVPGLAGAYAKYHPRGFEILGVSLDNAGQEASVRSTMKGKGMTWRQVYDGKTWSAEIAQLYVISSIPAAYLVDGDTGEILAAGDQLRGSSLESTIENALKKKGL